MDRNTVTGLVLIVAIMVGFGIFNSKQAEKYNEAKHTQDSIAHVEYEREMERQRQAGISDSANNYTVNNDTIQQEETQDSTLQLAARAENKTYTLENDLLKLTFTNIGGRIYSAELKNITTYIKTPLIIFEGDKNDFAIKFYANKDISTSDLLFEPTSTSLVSSDTLQVLALRTNIADGYIEYVYKMRKGSYIVDMDVNFVGLNNYIDRRETALSLDWTMDSPQQEKGFSNENNYTTAAFKYPNETSIEELSGRSKTDEEKIGTKVNWIAFKQQFFSAILINKDNFESAKIAFTTYPENNGSRLIKRFESNMTLPYNSAEKSQTYPLSFYLGTNRYKVLNSYDQSFEKLVPLSYIGIDGLVNRYVIIPVFDFFEKFIPSYGIIILILTLLIKLLIFPLTRKSYISMAKMRLLKPELDKISAKYPKREDAMKKQQETMALYKKTGTSMFGGCLPMLLQFPILIAMFRFFPASYELRQQGFLWADDLSAYDSILELPFNIPFYGNHVSLFALLMAISMFFYTKITMASQQSQTQMPGMKFMSLYFMPIMMLCFCNNFSSGLSYYYLLSNLITIAQMWIIRKFVVKDEVLLKQMQEKSKQPIKKSKFQQRLEDLQRQQQAQQKAQQQRKKK